MATPQEVTVVSYEAPQYGVSAEMEGEALSDEFLDMALSHFEKLIHGTVDPFALQPWREFGGIPLIMMSLRDELMVYAAEERVEHGAVSVKITCMFGGARTAGYRGLDGSWDGSDESLWRDLIEERCRLWFRD